MTSILAIRVPEDWATLEAITNLFSTYGNITLARVLRPGRPIPPDLRNYATQIPDMGATTCAVVDFDSTDSGNNWKTIFQISKLIYCSTRMLQRFERQKSTRYANCATWTANQTYTVQGRKEKGKLYDIIYII